MDIFTAFLSDWKNKVEQFEKKMEKREDVDKFLEKDAENLSTADEFDYLYDQFSIVNAEIENGHYYQDSSQFHGIHRQFQDMHLKYDPTVDYIQLDQLDPDLDSQNTLRVFQIFKRIEISITLDLIYGTAVALQQSNDPKAGEQIKKVQQMTDISKGVFITDQLFLPRYIWFKMKFNLPNIKEKIQYFNDIRNLLREVQILYNNGVAQIKHLAGLAKKLGDMKTNIGRNLYEKADMDASIISS